jgi:hypothetical protein
VSFRYEHAHQPLAPRRVFLRRLVQHGGLALAVVVLSIGVGMAGYHVLGRQPWLDAFVNACMLLGGMGQVRDVETFGGKVFAGLFALYAGLVFIAISGLFLAPVIHRVVHKFHLGSKS